jgi:hypothetical protein
MFFIFCHLLYFKVPYHLRGCPCLILDEIAIFLVEIATFFSSNFSAKIFPKGCHMIYLHTKIPSWVYFGVHEMLVYFMAIWYILCSFGIFYPFWKVVPKISGTPES